MGVVFFFVLSGFVLAWNYHGEFSAGQVGAVAYRHFALRRFARLYPLYLLALMLATVVQHFHMAENKRDTHFVLHKIPNCVQYISDLTRTYQTLIKTTNMFSIVA